MAKTRLRRGQLEQLQSLRVMGNTSGSTADVTEVVVLDEDNMASDSATALATQQSVKAYVDKNKTYDGNGSFLIDKAHRDRLMEADGTIEGVYFEKWENRRKTRHWIRFGFRRTPRENMHRRPLD